MARTDAPGARDELERVVSEYRHVRTEHRRARRGGRTRRRLGAHLRELELRFERALATSVPGQAARHGWWDHLRRGAPAPEEPADDVPLVARGPREAVERGAPTVSVTVRGRLPESARTAVVDVLSRLTRLAPGPVVYARASLEQRPDPALERPVVAKAQLDLAGRIVRASTASATAAGAIDLLEARLRHAVVEIGGRDEAARREGRPPRPGEWRHGDRAAHRPPWYDRPPEERRLVRRKSFAAEPMTPEEAEWEMHLLDHDFHLFADAATGDDAVVHLHDDGTPGLRRLGGGGAYVEPFLLDPEPAPTLSVDAAIESLNLTNEPYLFFLERASARGAVLYRRHDGHYGLVTLRTAAA